MRIGTSVGPETLLQRTRDVLAALDRRLTFDENISCAIISLNTPSTPDMEFTVVHNLGRIPTGYIWNADGAGSLYDSRRANWTESQMFLKFSGGQTALKLIVF
jgi:hypothetical protein